MPRIFVFVIFLLLRSFKAVLTDIPLNQVISLSVNSYKVLHDLVSIFKDLDYTKDILGGTILLNWGMKNWNNKNSADLNILDKSEQSISITYDDLENIRSLLDVLNPKVEVGSTYDMVLLLTSLQNISSGWELGNSISDENFTSKYNSMTSGVVVSSIGFYDTGKTYVINRLIDESFPAGVHLETKGLSIVEREGVFHIDTEGSRRAVRSEFMTDRLVTDYFVQQLALRMGHVVLFHVDALYAQDVFTIRRLHQLAKQLNPALKNFIVVHNMWRYTTEAEVRKHIETDIVKAFNGIEKRKPSTNCSSWSSDFGSGPIIHIVIAREGSPAGDLMNGCAFKILRDIIDVASYYPVNFHILDTIRHLVEEMLPSFFYHPLLDRGSVPYMVNPTGRKVYPPSPARANNRVYQVVVQAMNWILRQKPTDSQAAEEPGSCRPFENLRPDIFNVKIEKRFSPDSGDGDSRCSAGDDECTSTALSAGHSSHNFTYYMSLAAKNISLKYFPVDGETAIPSAAFNPKYDVFEREDKWVVMMDLLDSEYFIEYQPDRVAIFGCRSLKSEYQFGGFERHSSMDSRRFSTFHIEINAPPGVNCVTSRKVHKDARSNSGVLLLSFDKDTSTDGNSNSNSRGDSIDAGTATTTSDGSGALSSSSSSSSSASSTITTAAEDDSAPSEEEVASDSTSA